MAAFNSNPLNFPNLPVKTVPVGGDILPLFDSVGLVISQTTVTDILNLVPSSGGFYPAIEAISGNWYIWGNPNKQVGLVSTPNPNILYYYPILITKTSTYKAIANQGGVGGTGSCVMGIYASNAANTQPSGSVITNSSSGSITMSTSTATVNSFNFGSTVTLSPGIYWLAFACTYNITISMYGYGGTYDNAAEFQFSFGNSSFQPSTAFPIVAWTQSFSYSGTLPSVGSLTGLLSNGAINTVIGIQAN